MQKTHFQTQNTTSPKKIAILAPNLEFSDNIGSLFRLAEAMGVNHLYFGNTVDLTSRKIKKAARSTLKSVESTSNISPVFIIKEYLDSGHRVVAVEITDDSKLMKSLMVEANENILLVIGNESKGINSDLLEMIPEKYHIEMYGNNSSMNVISATSMALYQIQNG